MVSRATLLVTVLSATLGLTSPAAKANLIVNPTFAGIDVLQGGPPPGTTAGGWTFVNGSGAYLSSGAQGGYLNGLCCAALGSIQQSVGTVPGALYHIDFFLTQNGNFRGSIDVEFGGTIGYSATNPPIPAGTYEEFSFDATATSSSTLFSFNGSNLAGTVWIDNVSAVGATPVVPEPGSLILLAGGLLGLGDPSSQVRLSQLEPR